MAPDDIPDSRTPIRLEDPALLSQRGYIDGKWVGAEGGATMDVVNPATGGKIGTAPWMGATETRRAIGAAAAAFPGVAREDGQGARRRAAQVVRAACWPTATTSR